MKIVCEAYIMKTVFGAVSSYEGDMLLTFLEDSIGSAIWSTAGISMTEFELHKEIFKEYTLKKGDPEQIGINIPLMNKSLKRITKDTDIAVLIIDNKLVIETIGETKKRFKIPLIEPSYILDDFKSRMMSDWKDADKEHREKVAETMQTRFFPKIEYTSILEVNTPYLQNAIDDLSVLISSKESIYAKAWVTLSEGILQLKNYDEKWGIAESEIPFTELKSKDDGFANIYNFGVLKDAINTTISETVTLQTSKDMPIHIHYTLGDKSHVAHLISPIHETDTEETAKAEKEAFESIPQEKPEKETEEVFKKIHTEKDAYERTTKEKDAEPEPEKKKEQPKKKAKAKEKDGEEEND